MNWEHAHAGLLDELSKIADVSLDGLSPETILERGNPPPPMETPGYDKAKAILDRVQMSKSAGRRKASDFGTGMPEFNRLSRPMQPGMTGTDKALSAGGHVVGGMGIGKLMAEYSHGLKGAKPSPRMGAAAMTAGGAIGGARFLQKRLQERRMAKTAAFSPALQLKAAKQVGGFKNSIHEGKNITSQIRGSLIGRKFVP